MKRMENRFHIYAQNSCALGKQNLTSVAKAINYTAECWLILLEKEQSADNPNLWYKFYPLKRLLHKNTERGCLIGIRENNEWERSLLRYRNLTQQLPNELYQKENLEKNGRRGID